MRSERFRFHPEAKEEFREAIEWYRSRNRRLATEFRVTVSDVIRQIVQAPQRWPVHLHGTRRFVLQRFPFSVVYLDDPDTVNIVAVAHGKRKPGYWKKRL
jgi:plasmid stabilization system protein ParE